MKNERMGIQVRGKGFPSLYRHQTTGLWIVNMSDTDALPEECVEHPGATIVSVIKHAWVRHWFCGEDHKYYTKSFEDIPKLLEVIREAGGCDAVICVSPEYFATLL